jgi:hypothetical protein
LPAEAKPKERVLDEVEKGVPGPDHKKGDPPLRIQPVGRFTVAVICKGLPEHKVLLGSIVKEGVHCPKACGMVLTKNEIRNRVDSKTSVLFIGTSVIV